jgi:hypothetical protein
VVGLGEGLGLGERLGVEPPDDGPEKVTISCGRLADSRLARLVAVTLVEVSPRLTGSLFLISGVTSHWIHVPAPMRLTEEATDRTAGMFRYVSVDSCHEFEATPRTSTFPVLALLA